MCIKKVIVKKLLLTPLFWAIIKTRLTIEKKINILAISGSLRPQSSNDAVIRTAATLASCNTETTVYAGLAMLPPFNDDKEPGKEVTELRSMISNADGILICSPEYAFGVPGALKNALDWTVGTGNFADKPVAVITAATNGTHAHASLLLTLSALSARVLKECTLLIPYVRSKMDNEGNIKDTETIKAIKGIMDTFIADIRNSL